MVVVLMVGSGDCGGRHQSSRAGGRSVMTTVVVGIEAVVV